MVDIPEEPFFAPEYVALCHRGMSGEADWRRARRNIAIVGNANCASTCAMFVTLMNERHNTKIAVFGGKPGLQMQFKGTPLSSLCLAGFCGSNERATQVWQVTRCWSGSTSTRRSRLPT